MTGHLTRILATSVLAATLTGSLVGPSQGMPLPVTSGHEIAGAVPTDQVQWWGGWGWRRSYWGGGGALAAGLIGGLALGTPAASTSYYGYGYPYYGYGYAPAYYTYPGYYGAAYYGYYPGYYGSSIWLSGKPVHKRKPVRHGR